MTRHKGGCHCGAIAYEFDGAVGEAMACNCSFCAKRGGLLTFVPATDFTLTTPRDAMGTYHFNRNVIAHHFCPACGVSPFSEAENNGVQMVAVNLRCVDGIDPLALSVKQFNGRDI